MLNVIARFHGLCKSAQGISTPAIARCFAETHHLLMGLGTDAASAAVLAALIGLGSCRGIG